MSVLGVPGLNCFWWLWSPIWTKVIQLIKLLAPRSCDTLPVHHTVRVWLLCIDTPETPKTLFMDELRQHLHKNGYILEHVDKPQAGTWTVVLHVPAQRLDVARISEALERAGVCGSGGDHTSVVMLMKHSHACHGQPMRARILTDETCFGALESSVRHCLDWFYPIEALHMLHPPGSDDARSECLDERELSTLKEMNGWPLNQLLLAAEEIQERQESLQQLDDQADSSAVVDLSSTSGGPSSPSTLKHPDYPSAGAANYHSPLVS